jgi:hypothetical protein
MMYIVGATALVYIVDMMDTTGTFLSFLDLYPGGVLRGEVWRLISWVFLPPTASWGIIGVAITLYFYYFVGSSLENVWGPGKFTAYYIFGVLLNIVYSFIVYAITGRYFFINSMYLNLSMFFAFATLFPDNQVLLFFIIPVKMKWLAWVDAGFFALTVVRMIVAGSYLYALVPIVSVLNYLLLCGVPIPRRRRGNTGNIVKFKNLARQAAYERQHAQYRHKCEVCGRTDVSNPELEFRYCSRCEGFRCFCADHIENHTHFK